MEKKLSNFTSTPPAVSPRPEYVGRGFANLDPKKMHLYGEFPKIITEIIGSTNNGTKLMPEQVSTLKQNIQMLEQHIKTNPEVQKDTDFIKQFEFNRKWIMGLPDMEG